MAWASCTSRLKTAKDPQHAAAVHQRLAQEGADAFPAYPVGRGHPVHIRADGIHMIGGA